MSFLKTCSKKKQQQFDCWPTGMGKLKPVYFESQKQCAAMLGIPEHKLKAWKAEGVPHSATPVCTADLLEWIKKKGRGDISKSGIDELPKSHWDREKAWVDYERALHGVIRFRSVGVDSEDRVASLLRLADGGIRSRSTDGYTNKRILSLAWAA
jgi:hypothetical protein